MSRDFYREQAEFNTPTMMRSIRVAGRVDAAVIWNDIAANDVRVVAHFVRLAMGCEWRRDQDYAWATVCGYRPPMRDLTAPFCPFCGAPIVEGK